MTTSLAQQLKKLAAPQTHRLHPEYVVASLLFEPRQASRLERDDFYGIGLTGLDELEVLLPHFSCFRSTLFSESSKSFERSIQTVESNEKLNQEIAHFLRLVTPFLLLKPALKALEWLVNRYQIHLYNADDLMKSALPYHNTNVFVRIVQLLDLQSSGNRWFWLTPNQKNGVHLTSLTLYNHCVSDVGFFDFVCRTVKEYSKCSSLKQPGLLRPVMLFYLSTIVGALECCQQISENMLTTILSHIVLGFKSQQEDYILSTYMVLAHLVQKTVIQPSILQLVIVAILKTVPEGFQNEALLCVNTVMDKQNLRNLNANVHRALRVPQMVDAVIDLSQCYNILHIIRSMARGFIFLAMKNKKSSSQIEGECNKKKLNMMKKATSFIKKVHFANDDVAIIVQYVLKTFVKRRMPGNGQIVKFVSKLLTVLEKRQSTAFDKAFEECMQKLTVHERKMVRKVICGSRAKHKLLLSEGIVANLLTSLNHPNPLRRKLAIETLDAELSTMNMTADALTNIVSMRLGDDDPDVVTTVLSSQNLINAVEPSSLFSDLLNLASKRWSNPKWFNAMHKVVDVLSGSLISTNGSVNELVEFLLPFLFPTSMKELALSKHMAYKNTLASHQLISLFWEDWKNTLQSIDDLNKIGLCHSKLVDATCKSLPTLDTDSKTKFLKLLISVGQCASSYTHFTLVLVPILSAIVVTSEVDPVERVCLAKMAIDFIATRMSDKWCEAKQKTTCDWSSVFTIDNTCGFLETFDYATFRKNVASTGVCSHLFSLAKIIRSLHYDPSCSCSSLAYKLQSGLFNFLTHLINRSRHFPMGSETSRMLLRFWIQTCFQRQDVWVSFLLQLITEGVVKGNSVFSYSDSCIVEIRGLRLLTETIRSVRSPQQSNVVASVLDALPILFVLAGSHSENVRSAALSCIDSLHNDGWMEPRFRDLLDGILKYKSEIQHDRNVMKTVVASFVPQRAHHQKHFDMDKGCIDVIVSWIIDESIVDIVKDGLLECLENVNSSDVLYELLPFLTGILKMNVMTVSDALCLAASRIIRMFTVSTIRVFTNAPYSASAEEALHLALRCHHCPKTAVDLPSLQLVALDQCTKDFFKALPRVSLKQNLLNTLIDEQVKCSNAVIAKKIARTLKRLLFDGKHIVYELQDGKNAFEASSKSVKEVKGRLSVTTTPGNSYQLQDGNNDPDVTRKRMLVILEAVQGKRHLTNCGILIPVLFAHLKRCMDMPGSVDYDKQLLLVCLLRCFIHLSQSGDLNNAIVGQNQFNIELVIQCIRSTSNPRIHHHALLLLANLAKLFPEYVLHNAMSIFTFMGANVFRHDDSYSFHVITETVTSIVPAILKNYQDGGDLCEQQKLLTLLTRIFVDALPDIPEHRRIPLFSVYLTALGSNDHLWLIVAIILQCYASWDRRPTVPKSEKLNMASQDKSAILEFAHRFCHQHFSNHQVTACVRLIGHIMSISDTVPTGEPVSEELYVQLYSTKQRHHYMLLAIEFVAVQLSSDQFLNQLLDSSKGVNQTMYESLLHRVLECLHRFISTSKLDSGMGNPSATKFWKLMVHRTYELLDKAASLVPEDTFVNVVKALMVEHNMAIQCKAIEMLIAKLQRNASSIEVNLYIGIIPELLSILKTETEAEVSVPSELIYNKQISLLALKLMVRYMAGSHPEAFEKVLIKIIEITCDTGAHEHLKSSAILCLSELCQVLQAGVIVHLPVIIPSLLAIMDDIDHISKNELLLLSVVTAVHRIVENFANFLSPYLKNILMKVCCLSTGLSDSPKSTLTTRLKAIRLNIAKDITLRILLPAVRSCYQDAVDSCSEAIQPLAATLSEAIRSADQNVSVWHHSLFEFFLIALDYRSQHPLAEEEQIRNVENWVVEPLLTLVVKMSETSFRPFFIKFFDWATREGVPSERALVFYFVANQIADRLKSLFVLFAGHFFRNAAILLDQNNTSKTNESSLDQYNSDFHCLLLVDHVLDCLYKCFLYDNEGFLNQERFETLVDPLVDQLENAVDAEAYNQHISDHLTPCIGQFAVAASSDILWKTLSYKVLLKTRHTASKVRVAALQVIREMAKKLGEEFITLLPETIPFLAELMEDESEEVEKLCHDVIADMEVIVGEPLQKYFSS